MSTRSGDESEAAPLSSLSVEISASAVIDRMKEVSDIETDSKLADLLHTSRSNIAKWRSRNTIPYAEAIYISTIRPTSLEYILTGKNSHYSKISNLKIDADIVRAALLNIYALDIFEIRNPDTFFPDIDLMAKAIAVQYQRAHTMLSQLVEKQGLSPEDARKAAITAMELMSSDGDLFGPRSRAKKRPQ